MAKLFRLTTELSENKIRLGHIGSNAKVLRTRAFLINCKLLSIALSVLSPVEIMVEFNPYL